MTCDVEACDRDAFARGWCNGHYLRWHRNGDPGTTPIKRYQPRRDTPTYWAIHKRLTAQRGPASDFTCISCGEVDASDWAYDHTDSDEVIGRTGHPYSVDLDRYDPMCRTCHITFDNKISA